MENHENWMSIDVMVKRVALPGDSCRLCEKAIPSQARVRGPAPQSLATSNQVLKVCTNTMENIEKTMEIMGFYIQ